MSFLHFPWLRSSKDPKKPTQPSAPSTTEYALEGVKISLELLKEAASFVPVPYVRLAVDTAIKLITIGEGVQVTIKRVDDLNKRVWALMLVMIEPLKGKSPQDIPEEMQKDIEQMILDLESILAVLREIAMQNRFLLVFFKKLNEEKVQDCLDRLDRSLNKFEVSREINSSLRMWEVATGIKAVYGLTEQGLEVAKGTAEQINEVRDMLKQQIHEASPLPSREMPTKPQFFYGRDGVIDRVVRLLTTDEHTHVALLGTGGMGKTSVALAVIAHDAVVSKFGERRFWVPCVEGHSPGRFLDILVSCLRITRDTKDRLSDIVFELKASSDPRIILLDNFETCWTLDGHQAEIERILCALANIPHISLLITMRSNLPPSEEIEWHSEHIKPLDTPEARRVYSSIQPNADSDSALHELLGELGHMPLAITLMAKLGKKSRVMPASLLETWRRENVRTKMLHSGSEAMRSIDVSISLSVYSTPMKAKPEAFTLLAILSMFPAGTQYRNLSMYWAPDILDLSGALAALTETSLADQRAGTIYVHPVIRSYMMHSDRLHDNVKTHVRGGVYRFMMERKSEPGYSTFVNDVQELENEETNIQSILMDAVKDDFNALAVDALLAYCWYQYWTLPQLEIIKIVLEMSRVAEQETYISESLFCLGHMYFNLDHPPKAIEVLMEAREIFKRVGNQLKAARCLMKVSEVYRFLRNAEACRNAIELFMRELEDVGDADGIAEGLFQFGVLHWYIEDYLEALKILEKAQEHYTRLNKPTGVAHCTRFISIVYRSLENYDAARINSEAALTEYKRLDHHYRVTVCLIELCWILIDMKCYNEALARTVELLQFHQEIGGPVGIAQGLQILGEICTNMNEYDRAHAAYEESIELFRPFFSLFWAQFGTAQCLAGLSRVYGLQSRPDDAEKAWKKYIAMGIQLKQYPYSVLR